MVCHNFCVSTRRAGIESAFSAWGTQKWVEKTFCDSARANAAFSWQGNMRPMEEVFPFSCIASAWLVCGQACVFAHWMRKIFCCGVETGIGGLGAMKGRDGMAKPCQARLPPLCRWFLFQTYVPLSSIYITILTEQSPKSHMFLWDKKCDWHLSWPRFLLFFNAFGLEGNCLSFGCTFFGLPWHSVCFALMAFQRFCQMH